MEINSTAGTQLVLVRPEPPGQFTAQAVGLPELRATAATREEAIGAVEARLAEWLKSGQLVAIQTPARSWQEPRGCTDPHDLLEREYLQDLQRFRQEDLERTLREYEEEDRACSNSSSTPIT